MKLEISLEEAKELYEKGIMKEKLEECYPELKKKQFVEKWEDIGLLEGYYIVSNSEIKQTEKNPKLFSLHPENRNISPSKQLLESQLAEIQLAQILYDYYGENTEDWVDWEDDCQTKYFAYYDHRDNRLMVYEGYCTQQQRLYFKTEKDGNQSIKLHKDLWLQYFGVKE